jgi:hypothetical protein
MRNRKKTLRDSEERFDFILCYDSVMMVIMGGDPPNYAL